MNKSQVRPTIFDLQKDCKEASRRLAVILHKIQVLEEAQGDALYGVHEYVDLYELADLGFKLSQYSNTNQNDPEISQQFIEEWYSDYHDSDEVAHLEENLQKIIDGELDDRLTGLFIEQYDEDIRKVKKEYKDLRNKIARHAVENYINSMS